jgi:hypothetical protein
VTDGGRLDLFFDTRRLAGAGRRRSSIYPSAVVQTFLSPPKGRRVSSVAEPKEIRMRVVVDHDRCEGNAFCVNIAPKVFQLDDDEYAWR